MLCSCLKFENRRIEEFVVENNERAVLHTTLGQQKYLSTLKYVDGIVGNSSSGILEAPSFKIGTVNIGGRQMGRIRAESVIDCEPEKKSILSALKRLYSKEFQVVLKTVKNPYGEGGASQKVVETLTKVSLKDILKKSFFDLADI